MKLFTLYDSKAEAFEPIISIPSTGEALRAIEEAVKLPDHKFCKYKNDYTLFEVGAFNPQSGEIAIYSEKKLLLNLGSIQ